MARSLLSMLDNMATPCSVNTKGVAGLNFADFGKLSQIVITYCHSSFVNQSGQTILFGPVVPIFKYL
ncbi:hypothetical protein EZ449_20890 [Pedobacter frigidisoli]|uniref:Uncharacterized protein n=1 Tax=Pedobacter frigidisoli TaxID=2530455 RepID=A0A4R0NLS3_9SPHI|nr:hypothetical protein EZ449_20890 [Pedobacter frigidisoli]